MGVVVFGRCIHYVTKEEWAADAARHGVDPAAAPGAFGWSDEEGKWGWKVSRVEAWPPERCKPVMLREDQRLHRSLFRLGVP